jgi:hypothetical protein
MGIHNVTMFLASSEKKKEALPYMSPVFPDRK